MTKRGVMVWTTDYNLGDLGSSPAGVGFFFSGYWLIGSLISERGFTLLYNTKLFLGFCQLILCLFTNIVGVILGFLWSFFF